MHTHHALARRLLVIATVLIVTLPEVAVAAPLDPGEPVTLNGRMQPNGDIKRAEVSPDGRWVVYQADQDKPGRNGHLYAAAIDGSTRVRLSGRPMRDQWKISPDSSRVVFHAPASRGGPQELWSIPISGGSRTRLNQPTGPDAQIAEFAIAPDSSVVVYGVFHSDGRTELLSVPLAGGASTLLHQATGEDGEIFFPAIVSPDGQTVLFRTYDAVREAERLHSTPVGGGAVTEIAASFSAFSRELLLQFTPDGQRAIFLGSSGGGSGIVSARVDGSEPPVLAVPRGTGIFVDVVGWEQERGVLLSADSRWIVHPGRQGSSDKYGVFSTPVTGGTTIRLNGPLPRAADVWSAQISPDSQTVVYIAEQEREGWRELYAVPIRGGGRVKLNAQTNYRIRVTQAEITPDGASVVFAADQDTDNIRELYAVPITGGDPRKLSGAMVRGGDVEEFVLASDHAVYVADQDRNNRREIYSVPIAGGPDTKLNDRLPRGGDVRPNRYSFLAATDDGVAVYVADGTVNNRRELYAVNVG